MKRCKLCSMQGAKTKGKGHSSLGAWLHLKAVSEERQREHPCLMGLEAEATGQRWEEDRQTPVRALCQTKALFLLFLISQRWGSARARPQGDGWVLEVNWPESSLDLSSLQISRSRDAFHGVAWLPHLSQGEKFTHQEFLPLFNLLLGSVREKVKGARGARSGSSLQGGIDLFPAQR